MTIIAKVGVLFSQIRKQDVEALSPFERQRLASLCRFIGALAEQPPRPSAPRAACQLKAWRTTE